MPTNAIPQGFLNAPRPLPELAGAPRMYGGSRSRADYDDPPPGVTPRGWFPLADGAEICPGDMLEVGSAAYCFAYGYIGHLRGTGACDTTVIRAFPYIREEIEEDDEDTTWFVDVVPDGWEEPHVDAKSQPFDIIVYEGGKCIMMDTEILDPDEEVVYPSTIGRQLGHRYGSVEDGYGDVIGVYRHPLIGEVTSHNYEGPLPYIRRALLDENGNEANYLNSRITPIATQVNEANRPKTLFPKSVHSIPLPLP